REALLVLIAEANWHDENRGDFDSVLARAAFLRRMRPNHAATFWNSAVYEAEAGRALAEFAKGDLSAQKSADHTFAPARAFARKAVTLGITKPDNTGEYAKRQEAIRRALLQEPGTLPPSPENWDALAELEKLIQSPREVGPEHLIAYRRPGAVHPGIPTEI